MLTDHLDNTPAPSARPSISIPRQPGGFDVSKPKQTGATDENHLESDSFLPKPPERTSSLALNAGRKITAWPSKQDALYRLQRHSEASEDVTPSAVKHHSRFADGAPSIETISLDSLQAPPNTAH